VDGHNSLAIVGYDSFGRPYGKVEKMGTKIISEITLSGSREVKFTGQDGEHALCTIRELMHLPHF
jgi:hypothetical protein